MSWPLMPFEELYAEPSRNGVYKSKEAHGRGAKIVNMGEMFAHDFIGPQEMARLEMTQDELAKSDLQDGDLLFGRRSLVEAGAGRCSIVLGVSEPTTFESSIIRVRLRLDRCEPLFFYYWFRSPQGRERIRSIVTGTNVKGIKGSDLRRLAVECPDLTTQKHIASILNVYDDLIEVNRRRIKLLEEMARGLFEEWFVRFRFPGHETVPLLDTPNGPLPEGWVVQTVGDTFELLGGGTPSKVVESYWADGTVNWYTPTDLTGAQTLFMDQSSSKITAEGLAKSSAKLFPADSIMMTSRATIGAIAICTGPACTNQGFISCLPNRRVPRTYLYYWLARNVPTFIGHATGATFKEITKGVFKRLLITVPAEEATRQFEVIARPLHDMILAVERSNRYLAASRDLLLPRLISGQLSVEAAEQQLAAE